MFCIKPMSSERVYLIGAGGHGKVVMDALLMSGIAIGDVCVRDSNQVIQPADFLGMVVTAPAVVADMKDQHFHVSVGNCKTRLRLYYEILAVGGVPLSVMHPRACVSRSASIAAGSFVAAMGVVGPSAVVGAGVIVNHGAVVDHDCVVGDFCHIAPNATLGGRVRIADSVLIGAGANVLPGICIGENAVIGAGAVVTRDVRAGEVCVGVPAERK